MYLMSYKKQHTFLHHHKTMIESNQRNNIYPHDPVGLNQIDAFIHRSDIIKVPSYLRHDQRKIVA